MVTSSTTSDYDFAQLQTDLGNTGIFCLDVETFKTETFDGKMLMGVAVGVPDGLELKTYYCTPEEFRELHELIQGKTMIGFSLMFDLEILEQNGYVHNGFVFDVLVMWHLCDENEFAYSLDYLSLRHLKTRKGVKWGDDIVPIDKLEKIYGWNEIPTLFMAEYSCQDIRLTYKLFLRVRANLEKQGLNKVYAAYERYIKALQHLVQEGLLIDWDLLEEMQANGQRRMAELEAVVGFEPSKRKLLDELLYETMQLPVLSWTAKGQRGQDKEALNLLIERFPENGDLFRSILLWRNLAKADSTWYNGFKVRRTATGRIHPGLKIHGTVTGRLSSSEPNLQQIPRDADRVKKLFVDPPGYVLVELDYAGVELRLASYYAMKVGGDSLMYELLKGDTDAHHETALALGAYEQVNPKSLARQVGKTANFSLLYGAGAEKFQTQLRKLYTYHCTFDQAEEWKNAWHERYPGFRRASWRYADYHKKHTYIETWNKRRSRIRPKAAGLPTPHKDAFNRLIQGGCSQILMVATIQLSEAIKRGELDARMCLSVHDSIWFYIRPEVLDKVTKAIIEIMEGPATKRFELPFTVEGKALNHPDWEWKGEAWQVPQEA